MRSKIVKLAASFIGCKESNGTHRQIIDIYNAHKPLARGYKVKYTDAWCATFVSAMAIKCGMTDIIPTECGCGKMIELFKKLGSWEETDAHTPKPGDVIFYDWQDSGVGDNKGTSEHVGIVEKVSGSTITVIEGNISDSVGRRTLKVNGRYIRGYGVPKYKTLSTSTAGSTSGATPSTSTKPAVAKYKEDSLGGTYKTTADLNMRTNAGTGAKILCTIPKGKSVMCYGYFNKDSNGTKWLYVQYDGKTGYCSIKYLKK